VSYLGIAQGRCTATRPGFNVVNRYVLPGNRLVTDTAQRPFVTIPQDAPLLGRKRPLVVFEIKEWFKQAANDDCPPFAGGGAVGIAQNGGQIILT